MGGKGPDSGRCPRGGEFQSAPSQNYFNSEHACAPSEQLSYEGLPCCFYKEMKVQRAPGGRYGEDYAVKVQYADADSRLAQGCYELSQRISIIPEDTDCELGLGAETQSSLLPASLTVEGQGPGEDYCSSEQFRGQACPRGEESRALFHPQRSASHDGSGCSSNQGEV